MWFCSVYRNLLKILFYVVDCFFLLVYLLVCLVVYLLGCLFVVGFVFFMGKGGPFVFLFIYNVLLFI